MYMQDNVIESSYPLTFRQNDTKILGDHLRLRHSVELVGIKRVGISNFLRFFLYHPKVVSTYINHGEKHLFVPIDLNDLIEREIYPFWILTFKRIVDKVEKSNLPKELKLEISALFLDSIQSQDHFLTIENIRTTLVKIVETKTFPTLFFIRFDRLSEAVTPEFFGNLQGLIDATNQKLCYVFTSFRPLDQIAPVVFPRKSLSGFSSLMYLAPASKNDTKTVLDTFTNRYNLKLQSHTVNKILEFASGHVQYLHVSLIILTELKKYTDSQLFSLLGNDERIRLQSEEIWESLYDEEQQVLIKSAAGKKIFQKELESTKYLWNTGIVTSTNSIFNPFLKTFISEKNKSSDEEEIELSKKEYSLFTLLETRINSICDRDTIIESVWPEYEETGVSDWTIDRLVARLRNKLKLRQSPHVIITVKTRGYKMVKE